MTDAVFSSRMTTLLGLFDVNAGLSDEVPSFVRKLAEDELEILRQEYQHHLECGTLDAICFRRATACTAKDERQARQFFMDLYDYAFGSGGEPDVTDYWNR